jgi:hypothetical protein
VIDPHRWTPATLFAYFERRIDDLRDLCDQRFSDSEKAVGAALNSAHEAVNKAEEAQEKRNEGMNEFRGSLADQAKAFMTRAEVDARIAWSVGIVFSVTAALGMIVTVIYLLATHH